MLSSSIIKDVSPVRVARVFPFIGRGLAVVDLQNDYHKVFMYETGRPCIETALDRSVYGCGDSNAEPLSATIITRDGLTQMRIAGTESDRRIDFLGYASLPTESARQAAESPMHPPVSSLSAADAAPENFERALSEAARTKGRESSRMRLLACIKNMGGAKTKQAIERFLDRVVSEEREAEVPPIMKKEEVEKDIDKGLIMYQLLYTQQNIKMLLDALKEAGLIGNTTSPLDITVWRAVECLERAVAASELRRFQNEYVVKARKSAAEAMGEDFYYAGMHSTTMSKGIEAVLSKRGITKEVLEKEGVTAADMFYARLGALEELFDGLASYYEAEFRKKNDEHKYKTREIINTICISAMKAVQKSREELQFYQGLVPTPRDHIWTAKISLVQSLFFKQVHPSLELVAEPQCPNKETLQGQAFELVGFILGEMAGQIRALQLDSCSDYYQEYKELKRRMLESTTGLDDEFTLQLAIEYKDFDKTVELCERTEKLERLFQQVEAWKEFGFLQHAFQWYINSYSEQLNPVSPAKRVEVRHKECIKLSRSSSCSMCSSDGIPKNWRSTYDRDSRNCCGCSTFGKSSATPPGPSWPATFSPSRVSQFSRYFSVPPTH